MKSKKKPTLLSKYVIGVALLLVLGTLTLVSSLTFSDFSDDPKHPANKTYSPFEKDDGEKMTIQEVFDETHAAQFIKGSCKDKVEPRADDFEPDYAYVGFDMAYRLTYCTKVRP